MVNHCVCSKDLVYKARQFVTLCRKNEQAFLFIFPAIFKVLEIPVTNGGALREKKLGTIPALRYRASGSGPPGRPTGVL